MKARRTVTRRAALIGSGAVLAFAAAGFAAAEEMTYRVSSYLASFDAEPVGDVEGHLAGPFVRRGLAFFPNGEVAVYANRGTLDMTKGKGVAQGEATLTFEDGSSLVQRYDTEFAPVSGGKTTYRGSADCIGGTGRYAGITCRAVITGTGLTPMAGETRSDAYFDVSAQYEARK